MYVIIIIHFVYFEEISKIYVIFHIHSSFFSLFSEICMNFRIYWMMLFCDVLLLNQHADHLLVVVGKLLGDNEMVGFLVCLLVNA